VTLHHTIVLAIALAATSSLQAQADRVAWARSNAVALADSSSDASLASIRRSLDGVDIIFLGESSHGDGGAHLARVRLVRYLHERLGFNLIAWEAGVREGVAFDSLLGTNATLGTITPIALYPWWAPSAELRPMLDYVRATRRSRAPLRFVGLDIQRSGPIDSLVTYLRRAFESAGEAASIPPLLGDSLTRLFARMATATGAARDSVEESAERALHAAAPEIQRRVASKRSSFVRAMGERETELFERVVANITANAEQSQLARDADPARRIASYNLREQRNAENLLWLLRRHRGEKIIVWLHNVHAVNTRFTARFDGVAPASTDTPRDATARIVRDSIGARSYAMATVSFDGSWAFPGGDRTELPPAPAGSLAAVLHDAGFARACLDLRRVRAGQPAWLSAPLPGTLNTQSPARYPVIWPQVADGVLFVDRMTPSTIAPK
jgi:erythromycin esterase